MNDLQEDKPTGRLRILVDDLILEDRIWKEPDELQQEWRTYHFEDGVLHGVTTEWRSVAVVRLSTIKEVE